MGETGEVTVGPLEGHAMRVEKTESGRRWRTICECGYGLPRWPGDAPPTSAIETVAMAKGIKHWRTEVMKLREAESMGMRHIGQTPGA